MTDWRKLGTAAAAALLAAGAAAACTRGEEPAQASAVLHDGAGGEVGSAVAADSDGGIKVTVTVHGLAAGMHGAHVHAVGKCEAPGFTSAGGHWNPTEKQHGSLNPMGPHMGDLPNLAVGADGGGTLNFTIPGASVAGLLDADGAALVIHAGPDDMKTDPSGNSGGRVACGVFAAG